MSAGGKSIENEYGKNVIPLDRLGRFTYTCFPLTIGLCSDKLESAFFGALASVGALFVFARKDNSYVGKSILTHQFRLNPYDSMGGPEISVVDINQH